MLKFILVAAFLFGIALNAKAEHSLYCDCVASKYLNEKLVKRYGNGPFFGPEGHRIVVGLRLCKQVAQDATAYLKAQRAPATACKDPKKYGEDEIQIANRNCINAMEAAEVKTFRREN